MESLPPGALVGVLCRSGSNLSPPQEVQNDLAGRRVATAVLDDRLRKGSNLCHSLQVKGLGVYTKRPPGEGG